MAGTIRQQTPLEREQEHAARSFIEAQGFEHVDDIAFLPDATEPLKATSVHVQMPLLQFTYWDATNHGRVRTEIPAVGLAIPTR